MAKYIIKRVLMGLVVLFGVTTITFLIAHVLPSDPALSWAEPQSDSRAGSSSENRIGFG